MTIETENNALSPTQVAYYHAEALKCKDELCIQKAQDSARLQSKDKDLSLTFDKLLCAISDVCRPNISNETEIKAMFSPEGITDLVSAVKVLHPDWTEEAIALQSIAYLNEAMNSFDQSTFRTIVGTLDLLNAVAVVLPGVSLPSFGPELTLKLAGQVEMLLNATKIKGNFGMGSATISEAEALGKAWVGSNYKLASDGKTLISSDGLRTYRPPSQKDSAYATTGVQANFERLEPVKINGVWKNKIIGNGHLDITK